MIDQSLATKLINILSDSKSDFSEIFVEKSQKNTVFLENNKIERISAGVDHGIGMRNITGDYTAYAFINTFEKEAAIKCAQNLALKTTTKKETTLSALKKYPSNNIEILPGSIDLSEKVDLLEKINKIARNASSQINQVSASYADTQQDICIANSEGLFVQDRRIRSRYMVNVIATKENNIQTGYEAPGEARGWEFIKEQDIEKITNKAATRAIKMLDAKPAPAGKMTVVLSGEAGGTMIHEACGHSLEADFIYKKTSIFTNQHKELVASPLITVIDDGSYEYQYGYLNCDDEGVKTKSNTLIENGILKNFITDRMYAKLLGIPLTGNGRRESYRNKPVPRMTNTYIAPGKTDPAEIISSVKDGLFVVKMGGGQVNITNGDFVFEISEAYIIKNGKITYPVKGATLAGNGPEVLKQIDMVGNDISFMPGICGKGDSAPVSDAQPTLRISEIIVGGQA
jgi:TldD protein